MLSIAHSFMLHISSFSRNERKCTQLNDETIRDFFLPKFLFGVQLFSDVKRFYKKIFESNRIIRRNSLSLTPTADLKQESRDSLWTNIIFLLTRNDFQAALK